MYSKTYKALVQACLDSESNRVNEIMPWDLTEMLEANAPLLLDVREPDEFNMAHIRNSLCVPRGVLESACDYDYEETEPELVACSRKGHSCNLPFWLPQCSRMLSYAIDGLSFSRFIENRDQRLE